MLLEQMRQEAAQNRAENAHGKTQPAKSTQEVGAPPASVGCHSHFLCSYINCSLFSHTLLILTSQVHVLILYTSYLYLLIPNCSDWELKGNSFLPLVGAGHRFNSALSPEVCRFSSFSITQTLWMVAVSVWLHKITVVHSTAYCSLRTICLQLIW